MLSKPLLPRSWQPSTQSRSSLLLFIQRAMHTAHPHPRSCPSLSRSQHPFISLLGHGSGGTPRGGWGKFLKPGGPRGTPAFPGQEGEAGRSRGISIGNVFGERQAQ